MIVSSSETITGRWGKANNIATQLNMDQDIINFYSIINRTIEWAKRKEHLKSCDFVSVFMSELKSSSNQFYRFNSRHINCIINEDRVLQRMTFIHPYKIVESRLLNEAWKHYENDSLAYIGEETIKPFDITISKIKNFTF